MFFRNNQVNILKYLPEFLESDINFKSVANTCSTEHEKIRLLIQDIFKQFFIETATWGLSSYERILAITPKTIDDYPARRNRILARYQANQTSTKAFMTELVRRYTTSGTGDIQEFNSQNAFNIIVNIDDVKDWAGLTETLDLYKPAHLAMWLAIQIYQKMKFNYRFNSFQTIVSKQSFWNLGDVTSIVWDGKYKFNDTIRFNGIEPNALYRTRQLHHCEVNQIMKVRQNTSNYANIINGKFNINGTHILAGSTTFTGFIYHACTIKDLNTKTQEVV